MSNLFDYIKWRGDIDFKSDPFNEIDCLLMSELAYFPFERLLTNNENGDSLFNLTQKAKPILPEIKIGAVMPEKEIKETLRLVGDYDRFKNIILKNYVNVISKEEEKQFCVMTFDISEDIICVAYRGTDDTLVGWKEDFNMSFNAPIPAQIDATKYLDEIGLNTKKKIYVCGHSKGGNLASYAALTAHSNVKKKIIAVYSFDGPGFRSDFLENIMDENIKSKTIKFVPQSSVIGVIFDFVGDCVPIKSNGKGMYQHDAYNWQIMSNKFVLAEKLDESSIESHNLLNNWMLSMSKEERIEFVEALYRLVTINDSATLSDIASDKFKFILGILKADGKTKKVFISAMNRLLKEKYFKKNKEKKPKRKIFLIKRK